jgi:hypothetical protein
MVAQAGIWACEERSSAEQERLFAGCRVAAVDHLLGEGPDGGAERDGRGFDQVGRHWAASARQVAH